MALIFAAAAVLAIAVIAGAVVLACRGSARGDLHDELRHGAARGYERALHDARTVHNASAMGDQYHR